MRRTLTHISLAAVACCTPIVGQAFTSPRGFDDLEGDSDHFALFSPRHERFMQIDDTARGHAVANLQRIRFRQDGLRANWQAGGGSAQLTVRMGEGDYANLSDQFANNWVIAPTEVFAARSIQLPDWSAVPSTTPAPWSLSVPFDQPWSYSANGALAFELIMVGVNSGDGPRVDRELGSPNTFSRSVGVSTGPGCQLPAQSIPMTLDLELRNWGPNHPQLGMQIGLSVLRAPALQPTVFNFGLADLNLTVPGLCTALHADPSVTIPAGPTDLLGDIPPTTIDLPFVAAAEGVTIFSQALSLWPNHTGLPIALSNNIRVTMPFAPRPAPPTAYLYAALAGTPSAPLWRDRGLVVRFEP